MPALPGPPGMQHIGHYERSLGAPLERLLENALDWEHLPWLHASVFASIAVEQADETGWRAQVGYRAGGEPSAVELRLDRDAQRWITTAAGGQQIWTHASSLGRERSKVVVDFYADGLEPDVATRLGRGYELLYAQLYDEDEAMMIGRERALARRDAGAHDGGDASGQRVRLGEAEQLRSELPHDFEFAGRRFRLTLHAGEWLAYALQCPHWLGPLESAEIVDAEITCPWHGYRFDVRTGRGRSPSGAACHLPPAPQLEVDGAGVLHAAPARPNADAPSR